MKLPESFDANEWFLIISFLVITTVTLMLPRRFPTIISIVFLLIGSGIAMYSDFHFGIPPVDLYDINDSKQYEWFDLVTFVLYSPFSYLFLYVFDRWRLEGLKISLYVLAWSIAAVAFEAFAVRLHVYNFQKGWNSGYSFVFYLASQTFMIWFYYTVKNNYNRTKKETSPDWA
ncbi:hypothetical protein [Paenibacillus harenae]|uniref:Uncharacterized protein n=1 Tax=Paenibacillus harenae TaxID=306543 RepID=A0ABT9U5P6_PAEHA|nr:hypothetical protein [Paenibacillus harenae]MDQ0113729.1 hypothetical protein [Paenibacillus harenae]